MNIRPSLRKEDRCVRLRDGGRGEVREHKNPLQDSFQRVASELIIEERQRQECRQGYEEGEAGVER